MVAEFSMAIEPLKLQRFTKPGFKYRSCLWTDNRKNVLAVGRILHRHVFHNDQFVESADQLGNSGTLEGKPQSIRVCENVHVCHDLAPWRQVRGITSSSRSKLLHVVRNHALKPGCAITAGEF